MKRFKMLFIFFLSLNACDSPIQHRVRASDNAENKAQTNLNFNKYELNIEAQWLDGPHGNLTKTSTLMVIVTGPTGKMTSLPKELNLSFYATMPSMGHPMDDAGHFDEVDPGIYINKHIRFNMPGDWQMELWALDKNFNIKDQTQWLIEF